MAMLLGKKVGMTRVYNEAGRSGAGNGHSGRSLHRYAGQDQQDGRLQRHPDGFEDSKPSRCTEPQVGHARRPIRVRRNS